MMLRPEVLRMALAIGLVANLGCHSGGKAKGTTPDGGTMGTLDGATIVNDAARANDTSSDRPADRTDARVPDGGQADTSISNGEAGVVDALISGTNDGAIIQPGIDSGAPSADSALAADMTPACLPPDSPCSKNEACCSNICDVTSKTCKTNIATCSKAGDACAVGTDCCSLACIAGHCGTVACVADGQSCTTSTECCGGNCQGGQCQALSASCKTAGNPCSMASDCCSRLCRNGKCELGASYCIQPGDLCYRSTDCCSGFCSIATGATAGVCKDISTTGAGGCVQDGIVCAGCTGCCSRVCAPFALSGISICQPASGCRLTNDLCQKPSDCCGGDTAPSGSLKVTCNIDPATNPPVGTCANPNGCQPRGSVCGLRNGTNLCGNAREDCCDCQPPKWQCCKADSLGVPRCFGGSTPTCPDGYTGKAPCCIAGGDQCKFSAECCGGAPCVPDGAGVLRCLRPPVDGGVACVASGGACTTTGDCCTGQTCNIVPGSPSGSCGAPPPPPPPPPPADASAPSDATVIPDDASVPVDAAVPEDAPLAPDTAPPPPVCALYGQSCSDAVPCCNSIVCRAAGGEGLPCNGQTGCSCYTVIR